MEKIIGNLTESGYHSFCPEEEQEAASGAGAGPRLQEARAHSMRTTPHHTIEIADPSQAPNSLESIIEKLREQRQSFVGVASSSVPSLPYNSSSFRRYALPTSGLSEDVFEARSNQMDLRVDEATASLQEQARQIYAYIHQCKISEVPDLSRMEEIITQRSKEKIRCGSADPIHNNDLALINEVLNIGNPAEDHKIEKILMMAAMLRSGPNEVDQKALLQIQCLAAYARRLKIWVLLFVQESIIGPDRVTSLGTKVELVLDLIIKLIDALNPCSKKEDHATTSSTSSSSSLQKTSNIPLDLQAIKKIRSELVESIQKKISALIQYSIAEREGDPEKIQVKWAQIDS